jgi:hypothetical protein
MNSSFFVIPLLAIQCAFSHQVLQFLNTDIKSDKSLFPLSDVNFLVKTDHDSDLSSALEQFSHYGINLCVYDKFANVDNHIFDKLCTSELSPYTIANVMSHLSIYQYCIQNKVRNAYIVEENAIIEQNPNILSAVFSNLFRKKGLWELLYTDVDLHDESTGVYLKPSHDFMPLKRSCGKLIDKVRYRYGTTSYFISYSGMKKALKYYQSLNTVIPIDQLLVNIPGFRKFAPNFDVITNAYTTSVSSKIMNSDFVFSTGTSEWISPELLLTPDRFDLIAKYIYAKYHVYDFKTNWHDKLYKAHLKGWVKFYNSEPFKFGYHDFKSSFEKTINSILLNKFDVDFSVPVNNSGKLMNGSHRTGICLALGIPIHINVIDGFDSPNMTAAAFKSKYHLDDVYLDFMSLEYHFNKKNSFVICVDNKYIEPVSDFLNKYARIVHTKSVKFSQKALSNFLSQFKHESSLNLSSSVSFILFEKGNDFDIDNISVSKSSYLFSESEASNRIIATTAFNKNSVKFLESANIDPSNLFNKMLDQFILYARDKNLNVDNFCIDSGGVLAALGLRATNDIDILHKDVLPQDAVSNRIDSHNNEAALHDMHMDNIIYNPCNHFYYKGIKFIEPNQVKIMKKNRNSDKDKRDIKLIESHFTYN